MAPKGSPQRLRALIDGQLSRTMITAPSGPYRSLFRTVSTAPSGPYRPLFHIVSTAPSGPYSFLYPLLRFMQT